MPKRRRAQRNEKLKKDAEREESLAAFLFGGAVNLPEGLIGESDDEDTQFATTTTADTRESSPDKGKQNALGASESEGEEDEHSGSGSDSESEGQGPAKRRRQDEEDESGSDSGSGSGGEGSGVENNTSDGAPLSTLPAAWVDSDDERLAVPLTATARSRKLRTSETEKVINGNEYVQRLRAQFQKVYHPPAWADESRLAEALNIGGSGGGGDDDILTVSAGAVRGPSSAANGGRLPQDTFSLTRVRDANVDEPGNATVNAVQFHPNGQLLFTAGLDKTLRFFSVDGQKNAKLQSVFFRDMPIANAQFINGGDRVLCSGRRPFMYVYDVAGAKVQKIPRILGRKEKSFESFVASPDGSHVAVFGNHGCALLLNARTLQLIDVLKMNGTLRAATFTHSGDLLTAGGDGEVYIWDVASRRVRHKFVDDGCVKATSLAASPTGETYAVGSDSGVVNVYDVATAEASRRPKPARVVMSLVTRVDKLSYSHDGCVLALSSMMKKDAMRVMHVPGLTVFPNWPTSQTPLRYVSAHAWAPDSSYLAVGNSRGRVLLYRANHYAGM